MSRLVDIRLVRDRDGVWRGGSADAEVRIEADRYCVDCACASVIDGEYGGDHVFDVKCNLTRYPRRSVGGGPPPDWCPLRRGPAVVVLAEGA
jgi:hypothetical protein